MLITLDQALAKGHGQWRSFTCPKHDDTNPSARVNVNTGKWVCMVCGAKGTTQGYTPDVDLLLDQAMETLDYLSLEKSESWLDQFDSGPVHDYWIARFEEETSRTYRLGWDGFKDQPCYPIRAMNGRPLGVVHRNIDDPGGPKYRYPKGVRKTELLFGVPELVQTDVLVLVEGAMDVCAVRQAGHDAIGSYGSLLDDKQVKQIVALGPRIVWIAYDMDRAGHLGASKAEWALNLAGVLTRRLFWSDRFKDLGEMDLDTRSDTLAKTLASTSTQR
jgi:DNA primase